MQSGLRVVIERNCAPSSGPVGTDPNAKLLHVETVGGEVLFDSSAALPRPGDPDPTLIVATLDFLATGGDGYTPLQDAPVIQDIGIVRQVMKDFLASNPKTFNPVMDGRWVVKKRQGN